MADKGEYRGFYVALPDDWKFQKLSPEARAIFYPLKLKLGKAGIDVFYPEVLPRLTGYPSERVAEALQELQNAKWLIVEENVYWIRNGLRFDPSEPLKSPNQKKGIEAHLKTLPKLNVLNEFASYYGLTEPCPELAKTPNPSERVTQTPSKHGRRKTELKDSNESLSSSVKPNIDEVLEVFDYWRETCGHEKATLTPDRRAKIKTRLKHFSSAELHAAIDGARASPFHQGDNDRHTRFDFLETIFKTDASVERLMHASQTASLSIGKPIIREHI